MFGRFFVAALSLRKSARFKFRRKSFGRFAELALFSEGDDRTDYVDDNELGDARGGILFFEMEEARVQARRDLLIDASSRRQRERRRR